MPDPKPSPDPKSDIQRGIEGLKRQGETGTVNENAAHQLERIDAGEKGSQSEKGGAKGEKTGGEKGGGRSGGKENPR